MATEYKTTESESGSENTPEQLPKGVLDLIQQISLREVRAEFGSRLVLFACLTHLSLIISVRFALPGRDVVFGWVVLALLQLLLLALLLTTKSVRSLMFQAWSIWFLLFLEVILLSLQEAPSGQFSFLLATIVTLCGATLPLPFRLNFALCLSSVLGVLLFSSSLEQVIERVLIMTIVVTYTLRAISRSYVAMMERVALQVLGTYCASSGSDTVVTIRLLVTMLLKVIDGSRVLVVFDEGQGELVAEKDEAPLTISSVFVRSLWQRLQDEDQGEGLLKRSDLGVHYREALEEWFQQQPQSVFFVRFPAVVRGTERQVALVVPLTIVTRLAGARRCAAALSALSAFAKLSLQAARSRFHSSDELSASQSALATREQELHHVVHLVNNLAQDITGSLDDLNELRAGNSQSTEKPYDVLSNKDELDKIRAIESSLSALVGSVADVVRIRDILRMTSGPRIEAVSAAKVWQNLLKFSEYRAKRSRAELIVVADAPVASMKISCAGVDMLEAVIRAMIIKVADKAQVSGRFAFGWKKRAQSFVFSLRVPGEADDAQLERQFLQNNDENSALPTERKDELRAIRRFANWSEGSVEIFRTFDGENGYELILPLAIPETELENQNSGRKAGWILFVDDNPQVTQFYSRIAKAMTLEYSIASSLGEARKILEISTSPIAVVTDLQIGQESGFDLVREAKKKFGEKVAVIVVSGEATAEAQQEAQKQGVRRFLVKPVARSTLFAELEALIRS